MTDLESRLKTIRVCTDTSVETVITYWLIRRVAGQLFAAAPGLFWRPHYNTPLSPMLGAHADAQVIRIHAVLCGSAVCNDCRAAGQKKKQPTCSKDLCGKPLADGISLRGLEDLKNHRDVVGHPLTFQLDRAGIRQFVDARRDRTDVRAALVWDVHRSIVEAQLAAGAPTSILDIRVGPNQTAVLASILKLCLRPEAGLVGDAPLAQWMTEAWKKDRPWFEKHPDGRYPRKTDAELHALYERMKKDWEASR
ncbi:MAG TPA: hypothetical protein VH374_11195 [Polyangia bacterium]|nr:hypothetical protein [Polyangia bacterium]